MAVTTFAVTSSADDGSINRYDDSAPFDWPPTLNTEDWAVWVALTTGPVRKSNNGSATEASVGFIRFDTSTLPNDATVTGAVLKLYLDAVQNVNSRDLNVEWYTPGAWPPTNASDYTISVGTTAGAFALSGLTASVVNDLTLTTPGNVNLTGYTSFRLGISGGVPTSNNRADFAQFDGFNQEPRLEVTYTVSEASILAKRRIRSRGGSW